VSTNGPVRVLAVANATDAAEARRLTERLAADAGFDEEDRGRAAIVVTEAATNLVKHAGGGHLLLSAVRRAGVGGLEVLALDRGPGIANVAASLADGYSTAGSPGTGLGAIRRNAASFDVHSSRPGGTAVFARLWPRKAELPSFPMDVAGVNIPKPGEEVAGDAWDASLTPRGLRVMVVDGLGHGPFAREAAQQALSVFRSTLSDPPVQVLTACHAALRATRGAAVALAEVDVGTREIRFAGVGNVAAVVRGASESQHLVSVNGTVGLGTFRTREFRYPWPEDGTLVLATDGLQTRWSFDDHPGLIARDPAVIAAVLYREYARGRDDATVVVARERR
jgi:anti-sigma regulatory factor (Ser/Thr protein kinase)